MTSAHPCWTVRTAILVSAAALLVCVGCNLPAMRVAPDPTAPKVTSVRPASCMIHVPRDVLAEAERSDRRGWLWGVPFWFWTSVQAPEHAQVVTRELADAFGSALRRSELFSGVSSPGAPNPSLDGPILELEVDCEEGVTCPQLLYHPLC